MPGNTRGSCPEICASTALEVTGYSPATLDVLRGRVGEILPALAVTAELDLISAASRSRSRACWAGVIESATAIVA